RRCPNSVTFRSQFENNNAMPNLELDQDNSIEQLPTATRTILRSTQILTSLPQIISELVQNALDANARNVEVSVDCQEWSCWVRDDGVGISRDGLNHLGLGPEDGRYSEQKLSEVAYYDATDFRYFKGLRTRFIGHPNDFRLPW